MPYVTAFNALTEDIAIADADEIYFSAPDRFLGDQKFR